MTGSQRPLLLTCSRTQSNYLWLGMDHDSDVFVPHLLWKFDCLFSFETRAWMGGETIYEGGEGLVSRSLIFPTPMTVSPLSPASQVLAVPKTSMASHLLPHLLQIPQPLFLLRSPLYIQSRSPLPHSSTEVFARPTVRTMVAPFLHPQPPDLPCFQLPNALGLSHILVPRHLVSYLPQVCTYLLSDLGVAGS